MKTIGVYIYGDPLRGKDVIELLTKVYKGRNDFDFKGNQSSCKYTIDSDGIIRCFDEKEYLEDCTEIRLVPVLSVYYRGVPNRGEEIIRTLIKLGGRNTNGLDGCNNNQLYFINRAEVIERCGTRSNFAYLLQKYVEERFLPEKDKIITINGHNYLKSDIAERITSLKPID